jgi:very-short-patch-repair endonuclease
VPRSRAAGVGHTDENGIVQDFKKLTRESERTKLERALWRRIEEAGLPTPETQYRWALPERQFRSDFAWPSARLLAEVQGGIWAADPGRHNRGSGYEKDVERSNLAVLLGWRLLAFTERHIKDGTAVSTIRRALAGAPTDGSQITEQLPLTGYNSSLKRTRSSAALTASTAEPRGV